MSRKFHKPKRYPTRTPKWAVGMQKLFPGFYVDSANALHISDAEICEHIGVSVTPENCRIAREGALQACREAYPDVVIEPQIVEDPD
jgi:hypothetical protein